MDVDAARDIAERVLAECVPTVAATLRGPAAPEDVERLSATVGRELPADFRPTSWRACAVMTARTTRPGSSTSLTTTPCWASRT